MTCTWPEREVWSEYVDRHALEVGGARESGVILIAYAYNQLGHLVHVLSILHCSSASQFVRPSVADPKYTRGVIYGLRSRKYFLW